MSLAGRCAFYNYTPREGQFNIVQCNIVLSPGVVQVIRGQWTGGEGLAIFIVSICGLSSFSLGAVFTGGIIAYMLCPMLR